MKELGREGKKSTLKLGEEEKGRSTGPEPEPEPEPAGRVGMSSGCTLFAPLKDLFLISVAWCLQEYSGVLKSTLDSF